MTSYDPMAQAELDRLRAENSELRSALDKTPCKCGCNNAGYHPESRSWLGPFKHGHHNCERVWCQRCRALGLDHETAGKESDEQRDLARGEGERVTTSEIKSEKKYRQCGLCGMFRAKDVTHVTGTHEEVAGKLKALAVLSPCLRLMPYCKDEPRLH